MGAIRQDKLDNNGQRRGERKNKKTKLVVYRGIRSITQVPALQGCNSQNKTVHRVFVRLKLATLAGVLL